MPNKPGHPPLTTGEKVVKVSTSLPKADLDYLKSISPNVSAAIRQLIKERKSCNSK
jgi:hypothetical protein